MREILFVPKDMEELMTEIHQCDFCYEWFEVDGPNGFIRHLVTVHSDTVLGATIKEMAAKTLLDPIQ